MLTSRGWMVLLAVILLVAFGIFAPAFKDFAQADPPRGLGKPYLLTNPNTVALIGIALGLWFGWQWLLFVLAVSSLRRGLGIERQLRDDRGPVDTLWTGRTFRVRTLITLKSRFGLPHIRLMEWISGGVDRVEGEPWYEGPMRPKNTLELAYTVRCPAPGRAHFEGVRFQAADLQGFFYHEAFFAHRAVFRVLPPLVDARGHLATMKRHNLMPPPGQHRHRRPGSGSELLDLRDYLPGDPPKTIAWKVSARRDKLITKEFESEVPVRCTLFVDTSNSVRLGPPGRNALTGLVEIASTVAQATAAGRDLTGLCLFDEEHARMVRPARGPRHLVAVLNLLAEAAGLAPTTGEADAEDLMPRAYALAHEVYPRLLERDVNHVPFWLTWLTPRPAYAKRRPTLGDYAFRWLPFLMPVYLLSGLLAVAVVWLAAAWVLTQVERQGSLTVTLGLIVLLGFLLTLGYIRVPSILFFPDRRRDMVWRKQLAAVLSARHGLGPGGLALLMEDDELFSRNLQRFLAEHQVSYPLPLYDRQGRYLFAAPGKVRVLAKYLTRAVGKGRDNELFVLLADLLELPTALDPLLRAVKVALARHHRVIVICPWPPEVPPPNGDSGDTRAAAPAGAADKASRADLLQASMQRTTTFRFHRAFHDLRHVFGRLGVPVICAQSGDPPRLILERLDLVRGPGRKT
jgi:uncharacterized protein (DUF58 family)